MRRVDGMDDADLARSLALHLDQQFERLILAYQVRLYAFALRLTGNPQDAEEVAQDAFVRAYRALRSYPAERTRALDLKPWLYRIALNVCRNRLRGRHLTTVSIDQTRACWHDGDWDLPDDGQQRPEDRVERDEEREQVAGLLASIPERYRTALVLRFVEGLSYADVARVLRQPIGTAKANVHRGLRLLRAELELRDGTRSEIVEVH